MKTLRGAAVALCAVLVTIVLLGATLAPSARADQWDKKTIVTFNDAVEIPGQVLPGGLTCSGWPTAYPTDTSCRSGMRMRTRS